MKIIKWGLVFIGFLFLAFIVINVYVNIKNPIPSPFRKLIIINPLDICIFNPINETLDNPPNGSKHNCVSRSQFKVCPSGYNLTFYSDNGKSFSCSSLKEDQHFCSIDNKVYDNEQDYTKNCCNPSEKIQNKDGSLVCTFNRVKDYINY